MIPWVPCLLAAAPLSLPFSGLPLSNAKSGDWVTYRVSGDGGRASFWRMAAVGEERDNQHRPAVWIEVEVGESRELAAPLARMRMLVAQNQEVSAASVSRLIVAVGVEPPLELDAEARARFLEDAPLGASAERRAVSVREARRGWTMTRMGTLAARTVEIRIDGQAVERLALSNAVPLLGLVRLELTHAVYAMELDGYGHDAKPRIEIPEPASPRIRVERYNFPEASGDRHATTPSTLP